MKGQDPGNRVGPMGLHYTAAVHSTSNTSKCKLCKSCWQSPKWERRNNPLDNQCSKDYLFWAACSSWRSREAGDAMKSVKDWKTRAVHVLSLAHNHHRSNYTRPCSLVAHIHTRRQGTGSFNHCGATWWFESYWQTCQFLELASIPSKKKRCSNLRT